MIAYHYTTLSALYEIITTKSLLLTSLRNMNDPMESSYSIDEFLSDFYSIKCKYINEYPYLADLYEEILKDKSVFKKNCRMKSEPYSICFTTKEESLVHWQRYANNSSGVCIAFDVDFLNELNSPLETEFLLRKMIYTESERQEVMMRLIIFFCSELKHYNSMSDNEFNKFIMTNAKSHMAAVYHTLIYRIKNCYWSEEDEIRLLYDEHSWHEDYETLKELYSKLSKDFFEGVMDLHKTLGLDKTEYHCFSSIRACKRLLLNQIWDSILIPEITIGSLSIQNKQELKAFLKANGLTKTKVKESKIKIR